MNRLKQKVRSVASRARRFAKEMQLRFTEASHRRVERIQASSHDFTKRRYLLLDVSKEGSLGDDAMISGSVDFLSEKGVALVGVVSHYGRRDWEGLSKATLKKIGFFYDLGTNWDTEEFRDEFREIALQYTDFCVPGADVMDGKYSKGGPLCKIELCRLADSLGLRTTLMAFSFNETPRPESVEGIKNLPPRICVTSRDPLSHERLQRMTGRRIQQTADLAFLIRPELATSELQRLIDWVGERKNCGSIVIGVNGNRLISAELGCKTKNELCAYFQTWIQELARLDSRYVFLMLPHDYRPSTDLPSDHDLALSLFEVLYPILGERVASPGLERLTPKDMKLLVESLDIVVTSRMHLAIACLGVGTPPIGIPYQGKFEGLYSFFELGDLLVEPSKAAHIPTLVNIIHKFSLQRAHLRTQILERLPSVVNLAQSNFK